MNIVDVLVPVAALVLFSILLVPGIRDNPFWRAAVTPLASIIGSGFLIVAPMLGGIVGEMTPWVMLVIVSFAYLVGGVIRFNIKTVEPLLADKTISTSQRYMEKLSNLALFIAYIISVAFYLRLMAAFLLRGFDLFTVTNADLLTTSVLLFIGVAGWLRGLTGLELLEKYSVSIKLAIIGGFLIGLGFFNVTTDVSARLPDLAERTPLEILQLLAGMLLVVQGFETSRYLGNEHPAERRIRSMKFAQFFSALIYVLFAFLILPLMPFLPTGSFDETAIIDMSGHVAVVLPIMLIGAAAMSQFSAAIADTLGGGGLLTEETKGKFSTRQCYLVISFCAIAIVWSTDIYGIITYASRAFAFYYFAQTVLAFQVTMTWSGGWRKSLNLVRFGLMACALAWVVVFAVPVG